MLPAEAIAYSYWLKVLELLQAGIPYASIVEIDEEDNLDLLLGVHYGILERRKELVDATK